MGQSLKSLAHSCDGITLIKDFYWVFSESGIKFFLLCLYLHRPQTCTLTVFVNAHDYRIYIWCQTNILIYLMISPLEKTTQTLSKCIWLFGYVICCTKVLKVLATRTSRDTPNTIFFFIYLVRNYIGVLFLAFIQDKIPLLKTIQ